MTLKGHYAPCLKTRASFGAHHENLNEDRLYCQRPRCSRVTLDSDNIRLMRIFAGVPWKGGVTQQWGNRKRVSFSLSDATEEMRLTLLHSISCGGPGLICMCENASDIVNTQWSLPACWATATVTAPSPRDKAAAAGLAVGPGPPAVPVQPAATRPFGQRAVCKPATRPTSKSIYSSI